VGGTLRRGGEDAEAVNWETMRRGTVVSGQIGIENDQDLGESSVH